MSNQTEIILAFISKHDIHDCLWWRCDGKYAPVTFFINCNDLFYWGTSDCEPFRIDDIPAMQQAIEDCGGYLGVELWCCRKRGMRPQQPAYPRFDDEKHLWPLFDACGPVRKPEEEG